MLMQSFLNLENLPFSGCAGGAPGGLHGILGAELISGAELMLDLIGFDEVVSQYDLVITGEGIIDSTTFTGKAPQSVALRSKKNKPVIAIASRITCSASVMQKNGIIFAMRTELDNYDFQQIKELNIGPNLLQETGSRIGNLLKFIL